MKALLFTSLLIAGTAVSAAKPPVVSSPNPNIVYILADDMGYGDVAALNPECQFPTPHLDRMAGEGMAFTDAHASTSCCTPTRYGIMTGRYAGAKMGSRHYLCG